MEGLSTWVLSIVGIVVLSVLLDLFMPDGEMNSHIKNIINFAIIFVIILPLPKILKQEIKFGNFAVEQGIVLEQNFLYQLNNDRLQELEEQIQKELNKKGIGQVDVIVSADIFAEKLQFDVVFVDLKNLVILEKDKHIDIKKEVVSCILKVIDIKKEQIIFNE